MSTLKKTENNLGQDEKVRSLWKQSVIQFKHNRLAVVGLVIIVLFIVTILTTLAVDQITNYSFYNEYIIKQDLSLRLAKPSLAHPFGCDEFGRDLLLRILWGTKLSFAIGVVAIALSVIMGAPFGMIAAFYGGKTDNAIMRVMDVLLAVPYMLLAMAIVAALGTSTFNLLLALAVSGIAKYARIARAAVLTVKDSEFVEAARRRHLVYNRELDEIQRLEREGQVYVIRPSRFIKIRRTERDPERIRQMYELGREDALRAFPEIETFMVQ